MCERDTVMPAGVNAVESTISYKQWNIKEKVVVQVIFLSKIMY